MPVDGVGHCVALGEAPQQPQHRGFDIMQGVGMWMAGAPDKEVGRAAAKQRVDAMA